MDRVISMKLLLGILAGGGVLASVAALAIQDGAGPKVETSTQIFLVRPDGTGLRKLTSGPENHSSFDWSPNGRWIAHSSPRGIVVADVEGASQRRVTPIRGLFDWSPTSDEIAFTVPSRDPDRPTIAIRSVKPSGRHPRTLMTRRNAGLFRGGVVWSPKRGELAYAEQRLRRTVPAEDPIDSLDGPVDLVVVSSHGVRHRIKGIEGDEWDPSWSPDGRSLLFVRQRSRTRVGLWMCSPKGRGLRPVVRRLLGQAPAAWSPDGTSIAFTGVLTRTGGSHLYLVPSEGGAPRRVANGATAFAPTWSPNGSLVAFTDGDGHVRVVRPDGTGDRSIARLSDAQFYDLAWSPDSSWIAFAAAKRPPDN